MTDIDHASRETPAEGARGRRNYVALVIAFSAIGLFVALASAVLPALAQSYLGSRNAPDAVLTNALLLNIALILLGWQRYKVLTSELASHREAEMEARQLADMDDLTGSLNRRSFAARLEELLATKCTADHGIATIAIDLDNFKQVNDLNGHAAGDRVLCESAERIAKLLPEGACLARLGGDEFICAVPYHTHSPDRIDHLVMRMVEQVARPVLHQSTAIDVTVSIGIAGSHHLGDEPTETPAQDLMHKADIAMYHAKKQGKNRFYWFEPPMENELRFRNELEAGIRRGIDNDEFVPYYEQQIDLDTGEIAGFEMLARWESPEMGLVNPDIFIPIAEEIGVIAELSERLIAKAFEDAKQWDPSITLSVNISPVQMRDPWFAQKILKMLVEHRFPANRLEIEVTETCLHENIGMVRSMITSLRNQGVRVSLDDFGTGYASLSQLRSLPFDRLKIDRSFIRELKNKNEGDQLVEAIISMSDGLKMPITAEGIEDEEVANALKRWGQLKGQGYHYGRPEPARKVVERLENLGRLVEASDENVVEITGLVGKTASDEELDGSRNAV
ncbi:putative bifunctional diguanylate cyclase/phosphodiesterase [Qipengyuania vesicularis]|uniref:putative bifunctional diguanylate cyclase/phosphodiesterase n=1 Tax=Qipengyuania vesicularis TaxID=2867232 RepID=UPI001C8887B0|nr:EAL domain-containing protein [Qipengyuania vesicularis]MBX7526474.1 EAL domain-containing protein [Qipengyuania vesicularis]